MADIAPTPTEVALKLAPDPARVRPTSVHFARLRPECGRTWLKSQQGWSKPCLLESAVLEGDRCKARCGADSPDIGRGPGKWGRFRHKVATSGADFGRTTWPKAGPNLSDVGANTVISQQIRPSLGPTRSSLFQSRPILAEFEDIMSKPAKFGLVSKNNWATSTGIAPLFGEFGPKTTKLEASSRDFGKVRPASQWAAFRDECCTLRGSDRTCLEKGSRFFMHAARSNKTVP